MQCHVIIYMSCICMHDDYFLTVNFGFGVTMRPWEIGPVAVSLSGSSIAGETYSLTCLTVLFAPIPLPSDVPSPIFQWFFRNTSLPSGVTPMGTSSSSNSTSITYTSTLQFSPLSWSHAGNYMCRIGGGFLVNSTMITVNGIIICMYCIKSYTLISLHSCSTYHLCQGHYQWSSSVGTKWLLPHMYC